MTVLFDCDIECSVNKFKYLSKWMCFCTKIYLLSYVSLILGQGNRGSCLFLFLYIYVYIYNKYIFVQKQSLR